MWRALRKFGLEYCDLPTMLENISTLLRVLTLNIDTRNKKPIPLIFYIVTIVTTVSYFYVYLVSMAWFVFVRCIESGDLLAALVVLSLGITSEIGTFKLMFIFVYINKVRNMMEHYLACDALVAHDSRFDRNLLVILRSVKKRVLLFWMIIMVNGVIYSLSPLLRPGKHLMEDRFVLYGLEPMFETPNYEIAYILCVIGNLFTCYNPANITAFLMITAGYTEAQLISMSQELLHLWDDAEERFRRYPNDHDINKDVTNTIDNNESKINSYINKRLKTIIKLHALNINLVSQTEDIFRSIIAIEFTFLVIGLIAELLGGLENTYLEMPFALMQVGMDCFTGQKLIDASDSFARAVYECKWERFDNTNMKIVLMMMKTAQKGVKLSAGGITLLSSACFMSVLQSIYSAYTTLRPTMK